MTAVRITVVKKVLHEDLAKAYGGREIGACESLQVGQKFLTGFQKPEGFCDWAWNDIHTSVIALLTGASFSKGPFNGWMKDDDSIIACCTDGFRPVSFLLERVDTKELLDLSGARGPAPRDVYSTERYGDFAYTLAGLEAGASYTLRLHFAELYFSSAGKRVFHVEANGRRILERFDIVAAAGGPLKAIVREAAVAADAEGKIRIAFAQGGADLPKLSALELLAPGGSGKPV
jgi:uncharacterized repeat protein (TIGR04076 family)